MPSKADTENNPIVLDIGEVNTKVGVNGDTEPRAIIPTAIPQKDGSLKYIFKHDHSRIRGHQAGKDFRQTIHTFIGTIYFKYLQIDPKQHSVVICESLLAPAKLREAIADVLFKDFEVPSLMFAAHQLFSCFSVAQGTAVVLDCSYGESIAMPVIQWTPLLWASLTAPVGAAAIHEQVDKNMKKYGRMQCENEDERNIDIQLPEKIIEDIKVKTCFVTTMERSKMLAEQAYNPSEDQQHISLSIPRVTYYFNGSTKLYIPGVVREESAELLFEQDNDRTSVCTIVLDSLMNCPVDTVKELSKNIILTGGTTMLPGFKHRFLVELNELVKTEERYKEAFAECEFRIHNPPTHGNLVSWLGASIFGTLKEFRRKFVTKEYYKANKQRLPDWYKTDMPVPEVVPEKPYAATKTIAYTRTSRISPRLSLDRKKK